MGRIDCVRQDLRSQLHWRFQGLEQLLIATENRQSQTSNNFHSIRVQIHARVGFSGGLSLTTSHYNY